MTKQPDKTRESPGLRGSVAVSASGELAEPIILGDYELRQKIGQGGMGTVYAAWQRSLQRLVAVKVLGQHVSSSSSAVVRFQREAQAAAKLNHTHIVPIFGAGEIDGVYFYAMELVDGPGLNSVIQETHGGLAKPACWSALDKGSDDLVETLPLEGLKNKAASDQQAGYVSTHESGAPGSGAPSDVHRPREAKMTRGEKAKDQLFSSVAHHMADVAGALDYAHRQGVIHRDIKPHNLIMGADGKLRISDFGLARVTEQPGVTVTGEMLGSPLYMSPEQILRDPGDVDHRTDIYSLGATMYEWLTASAPYPGETREKVISKILTSEPRPPRSHDPSIPVDLETICLKAIERKPEHRYQTAGELREDLARYARHRPIKARRAGIATRTRKLLDRHRLAALAGAAAVVAIALTSALVTANRNVKTQTAVAEQAKEERQKIEDLLSLLPLELGAPLRLAEAARPMFGGVMGTETDQQAGFGSAGTGTSADEAGKKKGRAIDVASVASPRGIAQRASRDLFRAVMPATMATRASGPSDECTEPLRAAFDIWESDPAAAERLVESCLAASPDDFDAHQFRMVLEASRQAGSASSARFDAVVADAETMAHLAPDKPIAYVWRALAYIILGDAARSLSSLDMYTRLAGRQSQLAGRNAELEDVFPWGPAIRGMALCVAERYVDAISSFDNALDIEPDLLVALFGRAQARAALGNVSGAVTDLTHALEIEPGNPDILALRGDHLVASEDYEAAKEDYDRAMAIAGPTTSIVVRYLLAIKGRRTP